MLFVSIIIISIAGTYGFIKSRFFTPAQCVLSDRTVNLITSTIKQEPDIVAIQVIQFNLQTNTRHIVYTNISNPIIHSIYEKFISSAVNISFPIFTEDNDQNLRLVKLMNHEYVCTPYVKTLSYKYSPETANYIKTVCAVAIPPSFGEFKGVVAIFLRNEPTQHESDRIRIIAKGISDIINTEME